MCGLRFCYLNQTASFFLFILLKSMLMIAMFFRFHYKFNNVNVIYPGLKNQRAKAMPLQKDTIEEKEKPMRHLKSEDIEVEECSSKERGRHRKNTVDESIKPIEINLGVHEQKISEKLRHNAELI